MSAGDVVAAVRALVAGRGAGALVQIAARPARLIALRGRGLTREREGELLGRAWDRVHGRLPDGAVAQRVGWSVYDAVVPGDRDALIGLARGLIGALVVDRELAELLWQVALVRVDGDADRALLCDCSFDVEGAPPDDDVIAWAEPYAGADWRVAGRMPVVELLPTLSMRR